MAGGVWKGRELQGSGQPLPFGRGRPGEGPEGPPELESGDQSSSGSR
jgi:hypothetical protein